MSQNSTNTRLDSTDIETVNKIVDAMRDCRRLLFVTGAGMSADSGLPTYRGVGGLYNDGETVEGMTIEQCLSKAVFDSKPELTWKYLSEVEQAARNATYNRGHSVIAELESRFDVWTLTQNIDGFHLLAGSKQVIEIHGTMRRLKCTECEFSQDKESYEELSIPPLCPQCDQMLRPDVVLFDEMLPESALATYHEVTSIPFDITFSIGTTSVFPYIAAPIHIARQTGNFAVEINPGETQVSHLVDYRISAKAALALDAIWNSVCSISR